MGAVLNVKKLKNYLGNEWVHQGIDLAIEDQEILAIVGGSGAGKTTLLRCMLMLQKPTAGSIQIFGKEITHITEAQAHKIKQRWGVVFQQGALFSSLTVLENIQFPLRLFTTLTPKVQEELALLKIALVGLPQDAANKYPAELSGGMMKRAGLARALALDPQILFLDEPTSGLDPKSANDLNDLILTLQKSLSMTVVVVSHDKHLLSRIADRIAFLAKGKLLAVGSYAELQQNPEREIQEFFQE